MDGFWARKNFLSLCTIFVTMFVVSESRAQQPPQVPAPNPANTKARGLQPPATQAKRVANQYQLVRIKDITSVFGHRAHTVRGFGIVGGAARDRKFQYGDASSG